MKDMNTLREIVDYTKWQEGLFENVSFEELGELAMMDYEESQTLSRRIADLKAGKNLTVRELIEVEDG